jgi:type IV pilus assembly protein PilW
MAARQRGLSLVELMVAMVIGLIVLGAVTAVYLGSAQTARFQSGLLRVEENGRFAIDVLSRTLRMARYDDPLTSFEVTEPTLQGSEAPAGALLAVPGLKDGSDTIGLRFEGGAQIRDCLGQPVAAGVDVTNLFGVSAGEELVCGTTTANATPLAEGVEDLRLRYGLDLDGDGLANRYVAAAGVADWGQVVTVQAAILVNSVTDALADEGTVCLGCTVFAGTEDRRIRAEFQTTIGIRN